MERAKTAPTKRAPFVDHIRELQVRVAWVAVAVFANSVLGYVLHEELLSLIQGPLGQTLYYTSPAGGFTFIFKLSITFGVVVSVPVIFFHVLQYLAPLLTKTKKTTILSYLLWSVALAFLGVLFGYFVSLPAALHFLTSFGGESIKSLITADEYYNFALAYIAGFAILFQLPLVVMFINQIKKLSPRKMMSLQRYVILGSFIVAAILTPTPDPLNQIIMALPIILLFQISILLLWITSRNKRKV